MTAQLYSGLGQPKCPPCSPSYFFNSQPALTQDKVLNWWSNLQRKHKPIYDVPIFVQNFKECEKAWGYLYASRTHCDRLLSVCEILMCICPPSILHFFYDIYSPLRIFCRLLLSYIFVMGITWNPVDIEVNSLHFPQTLRVPAHPNHGLFANILSHLRYLVYFPWCFPWKQLHWDNLVFYPGRWPLRLSPGFRRYRGDTVGSRCKSVRNQNCFSLPARPLEPLFLFGPAYGYLRRLSSSYSQLPLVG